MAALTVAAQRRWQWRGSGGAHQPSAISPLPPSSATPLPPLRGDAAISVIFDLLPNGNSHRHCSVGGNAMSAARARLQAARASEYVSHENLQRAWSEDRGGVRGVDDIVGGRSMEGIWGVLDVDADKEEDADEGADEDEDLNFRRPLPHVTPASPPPVHLSFTPTGCHVASCGTSSSHPPACPPFCRCRRCLSSQCSGHCRPRMRGTGQHSGRRRHLSPTADAGWR